MIFQKSDALNLEARMVMPGGVSSPIRAFQPHPVFIKNGKGCHIWDADGNRFTDYCLGYGAMMLGHSHEYVKQAILRQLEDGTSFGAPTIMEKRLAEELCKRVPCADMVRLVNSGTEATMHCIRLARGYTGRERIVKMDGGFHGAHDSLLVKAGSGVLEQGLPQCHGVPGAIANLCSVVPFNDLEAIQMVLEKEDCAAVILEPVMANCGTIPPSPGYLQGLRKLTEENGSLLIFDEVITGLRFGPGGAQERYSVMPDLCTMGKVIGGGLPAGAFMGKREVMSMVSPSGPVYQAGTFSGNPLTCAAGLATLEVLDDKCYRLLNQNGEALIESLRDLLQDEAIQGCVQGVGPLFQVFLGKEDVPDAAASQQCRADSFRQFFQAMLREGIYIPPSQFESNFLSTFHGQKELDDFLAACQRCLRKVMG